MHFHPIHLIAPKTSYPGKSYNPENPGSDKQSGKCIFKKDHKQQMIMDRQTYLTPSYMSRRLH